uniref:Uroporphyrinogen decarboxylase (URO-D) domain-containing protein n=1 Tax=Thermodesulfobacterium geofontis TaxID=1295609 RepID=A0A7V4JPB1_9BACT
MYSPLERFLIAATLQEPDQVPACPFATGHFISWFAGIPEQQAVEYWAGDYRKKLSSQLTVIKAFPEVQFWPGIWPDFGIAPEMTAFGCEVSFPKNASPAVRVPAIKSIEDIDKLRVPDPKHDGLMPLYLESYSHMIREIPKELRNNYGYCQWAITLGPTDIIGLSMGYDKFLVSLYRYPDAIHKAYKIVTKAIITWIEAQREVIGSDLLTLIAGDADCFLNPKQFEIFVFPYLKEICTKLKKKGNIILYHNDGDTTHLLDKLKDIGANMFNYGQVGEESMDTALVKRKVGNKMCLVGGLNPIGVLLKGKPEEVDYACKKAISEGGQNGGFILSTGGAMAAHTPHENILAMINAARKYGKYPLSLDLVRD